MDFEQLWEPLERVPAYADEAMRDRPPYDPVVIFKILILAAWYMVNDEWMELLIRKRLMPRSATDAEGWSWRRSRQDSQGSQPALPRSRLRRVRGLGP